MFDSIKKDSKREKNHKKRDAYLSAHPPIKAPMYNGFRSLNNSIFTQSDGYLITGNQSVTVSGIVQRRLYPTGREPEAEKEKIEQWNRILESYSRLKLKCPQLEYEAIDGFITTAEGDWYGSVEHAADVNQFNAIITIKGMIKTALQGLKIDENDAEQLDWDDIIRKLGEIQARGFIEVTYKNGLSGGHGAGTEWKVNDDLSGSVPSSRHGRNDGALRGARGAVRGVISYHNFIIDGVMQEVDRW